MSIPKNYTQISINELKSIFEKGTNMSFTVLCLNKDNMTGIIPISKADVLFQPVKKCGCNHMFGPEVTKYYIQKTLKKHFQGQNEFYKRTFENTGYNETLAEIKDWLNSKIKLFEGMSAEGKENYFMDLYNALTFDAKNFNVSSKQNALIIDVLFDLGVLMRVIASAANTENQNPTLDEKIEKERLSQVYDTLVIKINDAVIKYIRLNRKSKKFMANLLDNRLLKISSTLSHSIRVYLMYIDFMMYYNESFNSGLVGKVRKGFEFYQLYYNKVFEKFESRKTADRVEDVFRDSMQSVPINSMGHYGLGAYIHDLGKFTDFEYYMAGKNYDEKRVQKHLFATYFMINGENHQLNTIYTAAFHHEYYGHGYGPYEIMLKAKKEQSSYFYSRNVISYDIHDVLNFDAVGYFPAKILEFVDVYDTILYPWFVEQELQSSTIDGVVELMKDYYIEKDVKLDPILFDVFISYLEMVYDSNLYLYKVWNTK